MSPAELHLPSCPAVSESPDHLEPPASPAALTLSLLAWYDHNARRLPWRAPPGAPPPDPYAVWLSEVMLQQTTVAAAGDYFRRFLERWPTVQDLAAAAQDEVLAAWAGLGYYARARNLHKCARLIASDYQGVFPADEGELLRLPGVGSYTAAAIAAIAFHQRAVVVDGNVERVMARLFALTDPMPQVKPALRTAAALLTPDRRAGDYAQAVMDLGATICTPRNPACVLCPWRDVCRGRELGIAADLPLKDAPGEKPVRHGLAFWLLRKDGAVLLRRRPDNGLLGGMIEVPSTPWRTEGGPWTLDEALPHVPAKAGQWRLLPGGITHVFTHFRLELQVVVGQVRAAELALGLWCPLEKLDAQGLPTVMRKITRHALRRAYQEN